MRRIVILLTAVLLAAPANLRSAEPPQLPADLHANETKEQRDARMAWWREAKFGMFIHWGVYAQFAGSYKGQKIEPGGCGSLGEWIMLGAKIPIADYLRGAARFNPEQFDADAWVAIIKAAGMKYLVITAKHHDGFAMYHTSASRFNIKDATPFKRDPIAELAAACRKADIKFGVYYSQNLDWSNPGGGAMSGPRWDPGQEGDYDTYIRRVAAPQVAELVTRFQPAVLWFDIPNKGLTPGQVRALMASFPSNPGMIYNNRMGGGVEGDIETPEQTIPATGIPGRDWETCMTINDTWGYKSYDANFKPTSSLLRNLVDIVSKGGNYLLNVGPDDKGLIPSPEVERLAEMGKWLQVNGEAIYGTTASPFAKLGWGRATKRPGKLYLHVFDWPTDGKLQVPGLKNRISAAYLLADPGKRTLDVAEDGDSKIVMVGNKAPDPVISVVVIEIEGHLEVVQPLIKPAADGTTVLSARLADLQQPQQGASCQLEKQGDAVNIGFWENRDAWVSWEFTGAKPGIYEVVADVACPDHSKATLEIGGERLPVAFAKTGGYRSFQSQVLCQIKIPGSGDQQLSIRPDKEGWTAVNLRTIILRPVSEKRTVTGKRL